MTKLHKIDREKLAEAIEYSECIDNAIYCENADDAEILKQAAENWLAITDPGFEVSDGMIDAGQNIDGFVSQFETSVFKAMIAKAGE